MSRYAETFKNPSGAGDARPTAMQIVEDEGLVGNLKDKVFLMTGASAGIGIETARALVATGARVFLGVRSLEKGQEACKGFLQEGRVELFQIDTSSLASVRAAAAAILKKTTKLNVLICNAGIMRVPTRELTEDGFESQLGTNYLGHFLFFWLLKDALLAASSPSFQSRLVNVSSAAHQTGQIHFDDFQLAQEGAYDAGKAYGQSKLAQIYMSNYIDRHFGSAQGLHALSLMPGGILTNLQKHVPDEEKAMWDANQDVLNFLKSTSQGAATTIYAALSKEWEGKGGKYLEDCQEAGNQVVPWVKGVVKEAFNEENEDRLWDLTLKTLGLME
ncbi:short chain dehydrogenase [Plectosphaerella cucumerina]|uniref:Short chain dehydrogenase n=1 Tax=Plectosphaerella cucumerina TaxID=40658 RepID=A0A8K0TMD6_9PEZI|nr:short chain dehydrogenase [Plectosphaerella cucumerina]